MIINSTHSTHSTHSTRLNEAEERRAIAVAFEPENVAKVRDMAAKHIKEKAVIPAAALDTLRVVKLEVTD